MTPSPTTLTSTKALSTDTLNYLNRLDEQSGRVVRLVDTLPLQPALRAELRQSWHITRQKLAYFKRELERADGELREELSLLHHALLPDVISYQVKMGDMMIGDHCAGDHTYLHRYRAIWNNFNL